MRLIRLLFPLFLLLIAFLAGAAVAQAQTPLGIGSAEPSFSSSFGPLEHVLITINKYQQQFYHALTAALKAMRDDPMKVLGLVGLSFAYGVFHAAGPGHGKAVISSYLIANETELKRGILISFLSSLAQGVTAVLLVGTAYLVLRGSSVSMRDATMFMERASFLLVAVFGAWLLFSKTRSIFSGRSSAGEMQLASGIDMVGNQNGQSRFQALEVSDNHVHGPNCGCGHQHMPDPSALGGRNFDWKGAGSAILAIGMRPCSGALIVLTFALLNGLVAGGVASVFAMSIGTAITVSVLAILAVSAKGVAVRLAGRESRRGKVIGYTIEIAGAMTVMLMRLVLFAASLTG